MSVDDWGNLKERILQYLCPPGNGVFTINTAKERRESLHQKIYGQKKNIADLWSTSIDKLPTSDVVTLGVCSDTGGGIQRGANWGPLFLREALLNSEDDLDFFDVGDIRVIPHLLMDKYLNKETIEKCRKALYDDASSELPVSPLSITFDFVEHFYCAFPDKKLFGIGGDHSVSYPLVKPYLQAKKRQGKRVAVIHFDAHTDLLVERLGIDICFGSWATHVLEDLHKPQHMIQIGIRSSGKERGHWESTFGVIQYWAEEVLKRGPEDLADEIIEGLEREGIEELYVSFDIDALDANYAAATGTPEPGGLSPHEPLVILKKLSERFPITGADMVEIAPMVTAFKSPNKEPETTLTSGSAISAFLLRAMKKGVS
jgi:agmatinase